MYIIPPYILFMGYIFVYDNIVMLFVTNKMWDEFKEDISTACIHYLRQIEKIANIDEDIERLLGLELNNINLLSQAQLYFFSNHIDTLTATGLIGVYSLLHNKTKYSFIECENISNSIVLLLPHMLNKNLINPTDHDLSATVHKVQSLVDSNIDKNSYIYIY
jgi:hypothetical protein